MTENPSAALQVARELVDTVRTVRDVSSVRARLDLELGGKRWLAAANALPGQFMAAEQIIQPLLSHVERAASGTIECGHLSAKTGFELILALAKHVEFIIVVLVLAREVPAQASELPWDEQVRQASEFVPESLRPEHVSQVCDILRAIPMPELVEWNRLRARLELEAEGLAREAGDDETVPEANPTATETPKPTINDRMKAELASNMEKVKGWTAQKWADVFGCGKTTIIDCDTWKSLNLLRQQAKAEKRRDRRGR